MYSAIAAAILSVFSPAPIEESWYDDFDAAAAVAREEGKSLLVDFTGSDWCGWCIRLDEEVFSHAAFVKAVADDLVLVKLDYPRGPEARAKVPNPARNEELKVEFGIQFFPTILLMTPQGEVFASTGYEAGGPEAYVAHVDGLLTRGLAELKEIKELVAQLDAAGDEERPKLLDAALDRFDALPADSHFSKLFVPAARKAMTAGTKQQKPRGARVLIRAGAVDADVLAVAREFDPKNEDGLWFEALTALLSTVDTEPKVHAVLKEMDAFVDAGLTAEGQEGLMFYFYGAFWYDRFTNEDAQARRYAKLAKPRAKDAQMLAILDGILAD